MEIDRVWFDGIKIGERHRQVDPAKVDALAESMKAIGLQQPISVWEDDDRYVHLVAGLHRLKAAEKLGWGQIDAITVELDEIDRELWEIDENFMRADLTPIEEAQHLARRKELFDKRRKAEAEASGTNCPTSSGGTDSSGKGHKAFAADVEEKTGHSKRDVNRALSRTKHVPPDVLNLIVGTVLDKGVYLDKLKKLHPDFDAMKRKVKEDLEAAERKAKSKALQAEAKERQKEAKDARDRARNAACDLLLDDLSPQRWDELIGLLEEAGGTLRAHDLREWQAPAKEVA